MFFNVEQLIVVVTMVSAAGLFFLFPPTLGIEIFEIFYFGEEDCPLSCGFTEACEGELRVPSPRFLILQSK